MEPQMQPVVVKTFDGATRTIADDLFAADAVVATRLGYVPTSQAWDGTTLTVVYERQEPDLVDAPQATPAERVEANARANRERAETNAQVNQQRAAANASANRERAEASGHAVASSPPPPGPASSE